MKLRIKGNTLRLRLNQEEVNAFKEEGSVRSVTSFDLSGTRQLIYMLEKCSDCEKPQASFSHNMIVVKVPEALAVEWTDTDRVGFHNDEDPEGGSSLYILVEKDFQCLHKRPHEDESSNFPNPLAEDGS